MALYIDGQEILTLNLDGELIETLTIDGVTVGRKPIITTQPVGGTITDIESKTLSVVADGLGSTLTYQWYKSDGTSISGATGTSYTFEPTTTGSFGFYCRVTGFGGYTQTEIATVTVNDSWVATYNMTIGVGNSGLDSEFYGYSNPAVSGGTGDVVGSLSPVELGDGNIGLLAAYISSSYIYYETPLLLIKGGSMNTVTIEYEEGLKSAIFEYSHTAPDTAGGGRFFTANTGALDFYNYIISNRDNSVGLNISL